MNKNDLILVRYPFSDLSSSKVRPAVVVNDWHSSQDLLIVPLTSKIDGLLRGEFVLTKWLESGLNVPTAVKRGIYTITQGLAIRGIGCLDGADAQQLEQSLRYWLGL